MTNARLPKDDAALLSCIAPATLSFWSTQLLLAATDLVVLCVVWTLSVYIRYFLGGEFQPHEYLVLAPAILLHLPINAMNGCYNLLLSPPDELKRCTKGTVLFVLIFTAATFWFKASFSSSRGILLIGGSILLLAVPAARLAVKSWGARHRWWGHKCVFYAFDDADLEVLRSAMRRLNSCLRPVLVLLHSAESGRIESALGLPVLPGPATLSCGCARQAHAVFVFMMHPDRRAESESILLQAQKLFGRTIIVHESLSFCNLWARTIEIGGFLGLEVRQRLLDPKRMLLKTTIDLVLAALLLVFLLPVFVLIAVAIWVENPGPVIFRHTRLGRHGKPFQALKFRTMRPDSERMLREALARNETLRRQWQERRKLPEDPRVTVVGRFLRRASLDELPQLLNVLRGEMSLIGPRPIVAEEVQKYGGSYDLAAKVRPGLTGLWQVSGRNTLPYSERVALDLYYIRDWSIWLDLYVLIKTPAAVLNFSATS